MTYITSTMTLYNAGSKATADLQTQLARTQQELSTGRHADLSDTMGSEVGRAFSIGVRLQDINAIVATNKIVTDRLNTTQVALSSLLKDAQTLRSSLVSAQNDGGDPATLATNAKISLTNLISTLNTSDGDSFIFGGINGGAAPITNYFGAPPPPSKQAFDSAFASTFGMAQTNPAVSSITDSQMQVFLSGSASNLFTQTNWLADWSKASSSPVQSRISMSQTVETSITANDPALSKLALGYSVLSELANSGLNAAAYQTVIRAATQNLDEGISQLTRSQANIGAMQQNIDNANSTMSIQSGLLNSQIGAIENVDPSEAATKVNALMTQIETAYILTAHIMQLSLAKSL